MSADVCTFCHGRPVRNAAAWVSLHAPKYAACPRCGRTYSNTEGDRRIAELDADEAKS